MPRSNMGDEMITGLAAALGGLEKQAAKDDDKDDKDKGKCKECDCDPCECDSKDKKDKDKKDDDKDKKKDAGVMEVLQGLHKLATELDELGETEASSAVDDALRVIVDGLDK